MSYEDAIEQLENLSDQQGLSGADLLALRLAIDALKEKTKGQP